MQFRTIARLIVAATSTVAAFGCVAQTEDPQVGTDESSVTKEFPNFAALARSTDYRRGRDWDVVLTDRRSSTSIFAIHGGGIEAGTDQLAKDIADSAGHNFYAFDAHVVAGKTASGHTKDDNDLHITSTNFDEPSAVSLARKSQSCVSVHGMADPGRGVPANAICVGGKSAARRRAFIEAAVKCPGFENVMLIDAIGDPTMGGTIPDVCSALAGSASANVVNRCGDGRSTAPGGLQLEMSYSLRKNLIADPKLREHMIHVILRSLAR